MKAFIFDMDGVIVDSEPIHSRTKMETFSHYGIPFEEKDLIHYMGRTSRALFNDAIQKYNRNDCDVAEMINYKRHLYLDILRNDEAIKPIDGIVDLLTQLKLVGIPVGLASSTGRSVIEIVLAKFGITDCFKAVLSGAELPKSKPDPTVYLLAAKALGVSPENCFVVEDAAAGVAAAKRAGMDCIAYRNPNSGAQDLSCADIIVENLSDIDIHNLL